MADYFKCGSCDKFFLKRKVPGIYVPSDLQEDHGSGAGYSTVLICAGCFAVYLSSNALDLHELVFGPREEDLSPKIIRDYLKWQLANNFQEYTGNLALPNPPKVDGLTGLPLAEPENYSQTESY